MIENEKFKKSVLLTDTLYHKTIEVCEEHQWSLSKTLANLVRKGLEHKDELSNEAKNEKE